MVKSELENFLRSTLLPGLDSSLDSEGQPNLFEPENSGASCVLPSVTLSTGHSLYTLHTPFDYCVQKLHVAKKCNSGDEN